MRVYSKSTSHALVASSQVVLCAAFCLVSSLVAEFVVKSRCSVKRVLQLISRNFVSSLKHDLCFLSTVTGGEPTEMLVRSSLCRKPSKKHLVLLATRKELSPLLLSPSPRYNKSGVEQKEAAPCNGIDPINYMKKHWMSLWEASTVPPVLLRRWVWTHRFL
jgi:hypothetical protein